MEHCLKVALEHEELACLYNWEIVALESCKLTGVENNTQVKEAAKDQLCCL